MIYLSGVVAYLMGGAVTVWCADRLGLFDEDSGNDKGMAAVVGFGWPAFLAMGALIGVAFLLHRFFSAFIR